MSLSNYINRGVIEKLDSLNHYVLSEAKERALRDQEDDPKEEKEEKQEDIDDTIKEIEKQVEVEEQK